MFAQFSNNIQAIILAFVGFAFFAVSDATVKWLTMFYPVLQVLGFYNMGILLTCAILSPKLGGFPASFKTKKLKFHIARGVAYTVLSIIIVMALSKLDLPMFYTIIFMSPFVIAIMARIIFKETVTMHTLIAICGGFIGVLVVMRPGLDTFNLWMLLPLLATVFVASLSLLAKPLRREETLLSLALYPALSNLIFISVPTFFYYGLPSFHHSLIFIFGGMVGTAGLIMTALAYQTAKANIVAPIQYTQIVWGILLGVLLFGTMPDGWTLVGAGVIIGSGLYLIKKEHNT